MIFLNKLKKNIESGRALISMFLILLFFIQPAVSQEIIWFSNTAPKDNDKISTYGMHRLSSIKGKRGQSSIIQWLRQGTNPLEAEYIEIAEENSFEFYLFSPSQKKVEGKITTKGNSSFFTYASKEEGYYNAYLLVKKVLGDTLHVDIAKSEMLNHSCRNGHQNVRKIIGPYTYPETIPAEVVRKREFSEDFHYFATSSDVVDYNFLVNGKAAIGAKLTLITQTDWHKTLRTDEAGVATFQFIQDYFSAWQELNNRKIYDYLIYGEITLSEPGSYKGKDYSYIHYTTSLSDGYRPAKTMYSSMFWALAIFLFTVVITAVGIFIYRLKKLKVYKEIKFDEQI